MIGTDENGEVSLVLRYLDGFIDSLVLKSP